MTVLKGGAHNNASVPNITNTLMFAGNEDHFSCCLCVLLHNFVRWTAAAASSPTTQSHVYGPCCLLWFYVNFPFYLTTFHPGAFMRNLSVVCEIGSIRVIPSKMTGISIKDSVNNARFIIHFVGFLNADT